MPTPISARPTRELQRSVLNFHPSWIVGQRLGCLAWAIADMDNEHAAANPGKLAELAASFSNQLAELKRCGDDQALIGLPASVLEICASEQLDERIPRERQTLATLRDVLAMRKRKGHRKFTNGQELSIDTASPAEAVDIVAQMILFSDLPALPLIHALQFFVDPGYGILQEAAAQQRLQEFLDAVRNPHLPTSTIAATVHYGAKQFKVPGTRIRSDTFIKNALLDALLAWPLLVFSRERDGRKETSASSFSVPVLVDLAYDGEAALELEFGDADIAPADRGEMQAQMELAFATAKELWRSKNGHVRQRWQEVANASCRLDFRLAVEVRRYTRLKPFWRDRSAQAYFTQVFLAKFVGRHVSMTAAISGTVEENLPDRRHAEAAAAEARFSIMETDPAKIAAYVAARSARAAKAEETGAFARDRRIGTINGHLAKYRFARTARKFRKLILPARNSIGERDEAGGAYIEVNYAYSNAIAADAAQLGGWRQHDYVRCPDIGHLIHREQGLLPPVSHEFVRQTGDALFQDGDNAVWLDKNHAMLSVTALLADLNFNYRFNQRQIMPSLSWSIVRAVPGETGSRFWHVFLKAIGASDLAIREHFVRNDTRHTAKLIQSILTGGTQAQELGCTAAPDIVVIFAAKHLLQEGLAAADRSVIQLDVQRVIAELNQMELPPLRIPYCNVIGRARIVFVEDDQLYRNPPYFKALCAAHPAPVELFERLSIFEVGFTLQMAKIVAGDRELFRDVYHLKTILKQCVERGTLWRHGEHYFLPHTLRARIAPEPSRELALTLKQIANSMMPGIGASASGGLDVAECFEAEFCREAQSYLVRARDTAEKAKARAGKGPAAQELEMLKRVINGERELHQRFFEIPSWGVLSSLNQNPSAMSRREVVNYAQNLLAQARTFGTLQPNGHSQVARSLLNLLEETGRKIIVLKEKSGPKSSHPRDGAKSPQETALLEAARVLIGEINALFDEAHQIAAAQCEPKERADWLVHVLTHHWRGLLRIDAAARTWIVRELHYDSAPKLAAIDAQLLELFKTAPDAGIFPEVKWYSEQGDQQADPTLAAAFYRKALYHAPGFSEAYPRLFGTLDLAECSALMKAQPGVKFWKAKVGESLAWIERKQSPHNFVGFGKARFKRGHAAMRTFVG